MALGTAAVEVPAPELVGVNDAPSVGGEASREEWIAGSEDRFILRRDFLSVSEALCSTSSIPAESACSTELMRGAVAADMAEFVQDAWLPASRRVR